MNSAGLVTVLLAGWLIRQWGAPQGYQISFLAAAAMGLVSVAAFFAPGRAGGGCAGQAERAGGSASFAPTRRFGH